MDTCRDSYHAALADGLISKRQMQVVHYMLNDAERPVTQGEVGRHFNDASSSFQPRFRELEHAGVIKCVGFVHDEITKRRVKAYRLTGYIPPEKIKPVKKTVCCPKCQTVFRP